MELSTLEKRLLEVKSSFEHQLTLLGRPGYDPTLTMNLKKDLTWFQEQKNGYNRMSFSEVSTLNLDISEFLL